MNESRGPHIDVELTFRGVDNEEELRERVQQRCAAWRDRLVRDGLCTVDVTPLRTGEGTEAFEAHARLVGTDAAADVCAKNEDAGRAVEQALDDLEQQLADTRG